MPANSRWDLIRGLKGQCANGTSSVKNFAFHRPSPTHGCILCIYSVLDVLMVFLNYTASSRCREYLYRVIRKSLRDFRPLRYINRYAHAKDEHVNKGRNIPSFCPTLQVLGMSTLGDAVDVKFGNIGEL